MTVLQKAPNIVVACATILIVTAISGVVVLVALGKNPGEVEHLIGVIMQGIAVLAGSGAFIYAGAAARSASNAEGQLNGNLDKKIQESIKTALIAHDAEVHGTAPTVPPPNTSAIL